MAYMVGGGGVKGPVSIRLDSEAYERFSRLVKAQGISIGDLVESWVIAYVNRYEFLVKEVPNELRGCKGCNARFSEGVLKATKGACPQCGMQV